MSRVPQPAASRGSQKWLQVLINDYPQIIDELLAPRLQLAHGDNISWLSPLKEDDYAEYRDAQFLKKLGVALSRRRLKDFWPNGGPQWDALARTGSGEVVLVEAKAHVSELISPPTAASEPSLRRIHDSLDEVKRFLRSKSKVDWGDCFYQYTNRLAHLYLLRHLNGLPAFLVLLYFTNDLEMDGPVCEREWKAATALLEGVLDIQRHPLSEYVLDVFVDVRDLKAGRKRAVLLDIEEYNRLISRLEDSEDALELDEAVRTAEAFRDYREIREELRREGRL